MFHVLNKSWKQYPTKQKLYGYLSHKPSCYGFNILPTLNIAQSAGAVEYTDCISAEG